MRSKSLRGLLLAAGAAFLLAACSSMMASGPGEYFDDTVITAKVKAAFLRDDKVQALRIRVETYRGTVQLTGFASSQIEMDRAVELARGVSGVLEVRNDIVVR